MPGQVKKLKKSHILMVTLGIGVIGFFTYVIILFEQFKRIFSYLKDHD